MKIKELIPFRIRKFFFFLLKSPQRESGYYITYRTDVAGIISLISKYLASWLTFQKKDLQPVSICTGLKNRSHNYLAFVLESVLQMENLHLIELSVFDCNSTDVPELELAIRKKWKGKLIFSSENCSFTRAYTFNKAIAQAGNALIFAADADMTLPKDLVKQCNKFVSKKSVWFPVSFYLHENKQAVINKENGYWNPTGKGIFASYKWQFNKIGKYDEIYKIWGEEDWDLWRRFYKNGFLPIRNNCKGLFHNYHENPNRY